MKKFFVFLTAFLFLFSYNFSFASFLISDGSVSALYPFDSNSNDLSFNANNGSDSSTSYSTAGKFGNSLTLTATSTSKVVITNTSSTQLASGDFYISFWFKKPDATARYVGIKRNGTYTAWEWYLLIGNGVGFSMNSGQNTINSSFNTAQDGNWHNVVINRKKGGTDKMYVDNAISGSVADDNGAYGNLAPITFGQDPNFPNSNNWNGQIDDFVIGSGNLTTYQINSIYNNGTGNNICLTFGCDTIPVTVNTSSTNSFAATFDDSKIIVVLTGLLIFGIFDISRRMFAKTSRI